MATTALGLIKRAMRLTGALGSGETPTADEQADGLTALNNMLDAWTIRNLNVYQIQDETFSWASGNTTRTMGSGGDFATTRPAEFEGFFQRQNSVDYPISRATEEQYSAIPDKASTSTLITWIYPEMGWPLVTLYAYPVPSVNVSLHIRSWVSLQSFTAATTQIAMPQGYEDAVVYNLAVRLADEYDRPVRPNVLRLAMSTLRGIKQRNNRLPRAILEPSYLGGGPTFDYRTGF